MFLTVHAAAGLVIGQAVRQPAWAFSLSLLSHYFLDLIPHGDEGLGRWLYDRPKRLWVIGFIDLILAGLVCVFFIQKVEGQNLVPLISGVAGGILPDFLSELHHQSHHYLAPLHRRLQIFRRPLFSHLLAGQQGLHHRLHWLIVWNLPWRVGVAFQFVLAALLIFIAAKI